MGRVRHAIFGVFAFFTVIFFAGCPDALSPPEMPAGRDKVLVVQIAGESLAGRTALPSVIPSPAKYTISVTRTDPGDLGVFTFPPLPMHFPIELAVAPAAGDIVTVEGLNDSDGIIAAGTYTLPSGYAGGAITVTLGLPQTGTGDVALAVDFPPGTSGDPDEITAAELSLYRSLADYQGGRVYSFKRYRKDTMGGEYGAGEDLGTSIPINYPLPSGNYVVQIDFFRFKYVRVSRLIQTIIVRDGLTTDRWDNGTNTLTWEADKFASSNAELDGISIGGTDIGLTFGTYTYAKSIAVTEALTSPVSLTISRTETGQTVTAWLNGNTDNEKISLTRNGNTFNGGLTPIKAANSIVIAVTAPDGVTNRTYTVSYTYYNQTQWYVKEGGNNDISNTGENDDTPMATVEEVLKRVKSSYTVSTQGLKWPGKDSNNPVAARITVIGTLNENVVINESQLPPILLMGSTSGKIDSADEPDKRPLTIENGVTVILEDGLTLTGGNHTDGGGVYVTGANSSFIMNGGTISGNNATGGGGGVFVRDGGSFIMNNGTIGGSSAEDKNTAESGGGVYVTDTGSRFTMNGGTISGNNATGGGGGVFVRDGGSFIMNNGTIGGSSAEDKNTAEFGGGVFLQYAAFIVTGGTISGNDAAQNGGGVYVNDGSSFTMNGGSVSGNNTIDGGGVYVTEYGSSFTMSAGSVSGNNATNGGGGVFITSIGRFTISGGTISGNTATDGGGVYHDSSDWFTMTKDALITQDNDVYLPSGKTIEVMKDSLSLTATPYAARITPSDYSDQRQVLHGNYAGASFNYTKFTVTPAADNTEWVIDSGGYLQQEP
jgi:hypothetical protein